MSYTVTNAFIQLYNTEVQKAFQQQGSKLRNLVRLVTGVGASTYRFPTLGKGTATAKARHADVTPMNLAHSYVDCTLEDRYAPEYLDKLDDFKTNIDNRGAYAQSAAWALGRYYDTLIASCLNQSTTTIGVAYGTGGVAMGLTKIKISYAIELLNAAHVPDDGRRVGVVTSHLWEELMNITEFKNSDYIGTGSMPFMGGQEVKKWRNVNWLVYEDLPTDANSYPYAFIYHPQAIGVAEGPGGIMSAIDWVPEKVSWLVNSYFSAGCGLIDTTGAIKVLCNNTATSSVA